MSRADGGDTSSGRPPNVDEDKDRASGEAMDVDKWRRPMQLRGNLGGNLLYCSSASLYCSMYFCPHFLAASTHFLRALLLLTGICDITSRCFHGARSLFRLCNRNRSVRATLARPTPTRLKFVFARPTPGSVSLLVLLNFPLFSPQAYFRHTDRPLSPTESLQACTIDVSSI